MSSAITSFVLMFGAILAGGAVAFFSFNRKMVFQVVVIWAIIYVLAMFTHMLVIIGACLLCSVAIRHQPMYFKVFIYATLLPAMPINAYQIPFPGLGFLWDATLVRLMALCLFFPAFWTYLQKSMREGWDFNLADLAFVGYVAFSALLIVAGGLGIGAIRDGFNLIVDYLLPYFVISRYLRDPKALNWVFSGFLVSALFISVMGVIESVLGWRPAGQMLIALGLDYDPVALVAYNRNGVVRSGGGPILQSLAFAYFCAIALVTAYFFMLKRQLRLIPGLLVCGTIFLGLIFTNSKGGLLAVMCGVFFIHANNFHPLLKKLMTIGAILMVPAVIQFFNSGAYLAFDTDGSFIYRYQLIQNSLAAIQSNLLFGSADFLYHPALQASMQGEGIIDITNTYLWIALSSGVIGLFLFMMRFVFLFSSVMKKPVVLEFDHKEIIISLMGMTLVFIATCSLVSVIPTYIILILSIARAYVGFPDASYQSEVNVQSSSVAK